MEPRIATSWAFGPFQLDPMKRVLSRDGEPVPLTPKALDTLALAPACSSTYSPIVRSASAPAPVMVNRTLYGTMRTSSQPLNTSPVVVRPVKQPWVLVSVNVVAWVSEICTTKSCIFSRCNISLIRVWGGDNYDSCSRVTNNLTQTL